jgi:hypothetical protein
MRNSFVELNGTYTGLILSSGIIPDDGRVVDNK